jgi:hypothetical protein
MYHFEILIKCLLTVFFPDIFMPYFSIAFNITTFTPRPAKSLVRDEAPSLEPRVW